jgi:AraC-like DNA-binding protein
VSPNQHLRRDGAGNGHPFGTSRRRATRELQKNTIVAAVVDGLSWLVPVAVMKGPVPGGDGALQRLGSAWQPTLAREATTAQALPLVIREVDAIDVEDLFLVRLSSDAQVVAQAEEPVQVGDTTYQMILMLRGRCVVSQDGREAELGAGDFALIDGLRPHQLHFPGGFEALVLVCPKDRLGVHPEVIRLLAAVSFSGEKGIAAIASVFLIELAERMGEVSPSSAGRVAGVVVDLVLTVVNERMAQMAEGATSRIDLLSRVMAYMDARLNDPDLDPAAIAAAHHISKRYLYKLFDGEGTTVASWIRIRRLERCRRDLARSELEGRPVRALAARWGLANPTSFSRLFREAYGVSPQQYRRLYLLGEVPQGHPDTETAREMCTDQEELFLPG